MADKTMHHTVIGPDTFELVDQSARAGVDQLKNALITDSASGAIASFPDGGDGFAVKGLSVDIEPIQAGSGDPSPDNVRPISGRTAVTVTRTGKNLLAKPFLVGSTATTKADAFYVKAGTYQLSFDVTNATSWRVCARTYDNAGNNKNDSEWKPTSPSGISYNSGWAGWLMGNNTSTKSWIYTFPKDCYVVFLLGVGDVTSSTVVSNAQLEVGSAQTAYEAPQIQQITLPLGQTVYGATLDVTQGVLTVDMAEVDLGTLSWNKIDVTQGTLFRASVGSIKQVADSLNLVCSEYRTTTPANRSNKTISKPTGTNVDIIDNSYADATTFKTAMSGVQLVYELAQPVTVQLTAQQMTTLLGQNNVWSDADSVSVDYVADTKLYIEQLTEPDADMIADANITSGKYFLVGNSLYFATANIANGAAIVVGVNCTRTSLAEALNTINS